MVYIGGLDASRFYIYDSTHMWSEFISYTCQQVSGYHCFMSIGETHVPTACGLLRYIHTLIDKLPEVHLPNVHPITGPKLTNLHILLIYGQRLRTGRHSVRSVCNGCVMYRTGIYCFLKYTVRDSFRFVSNPCRYGEQLLVHMIEQRRWTPTRWGNVHVHMPEVEKSPKGKKDSPGYAQNT